jgi:acyl-CoA synthetase (NDP forming)
MDAESMVVIGASTNPGKPGAMLLSVLMETGFNGRLAGVNPAGGEVKGVKLYPSVSEVPFDPDLAVILIKPGAVPAALRECTAKNVKGAIVSSEGFAETGEPGRLLQ